MNTKASAKITPPGGAEPELIVRACAGDQSAFATLYNDNQQSVYRYFHFRVRNRQLAEDLTQEVFVRALRRIDTFKVGAGSNFEAWLVTIARNLYFDHLKSARNRYECPTSEFAEVLDSGEQDRSAEQNALRGLEVVEATDTASRALAVLNPAQRRCVELRYMHGLTAPETAAQLKVTVGAVKTMTFRAMEKMRAELRTGAVAA
ncbi:sigma-70 family RNA polymerase sigma factor [Streptomyces sp. LBUM 1479]|uniref:RNA polymerase sigma factor n=1 Tax=Streptomyces scabiei TaxID=1930 RepID=UPI001B30D8FB|nr:sigma-70 family RNA polymerase sigma factor [Streptomyces sp. LBUM 1475]MBP5930147.1 sigma-70 family RNA polymerase sigma factor [Streptomyces sp. LBUM 1479]QTU63168.1 sigma-70 family RNA polymerase sigma factor [Streptomyces sp. LBUM 1475]